MTLWMGVVGGTVLWSSGQPQVICVLQTAGNLSFVFLPCTIKNLPDAIAPQDFE